MMFQKYKILFFIVLAGVIALPVVDIKAIEVPEEENTKVSDDEPRESKRTLDVSKLYDEPSKGRFTYVRSGNYKLFKNNQVFKIVQRSGNSYLTDTGYWLNLTGNDEVREVVSFKNKNYHLNNSTYLYTEPFFSATTQTSIEIPAGEYLASMQAAEFTYVSTIHGDGWIAPQYNQNFNYNASLFSKYSDIPSSLSKSNLSGIPLYRKIIPYREASRPGFSMKPEFITIHNTANFQAGATASQHANLQFNGNSGYTSWHFTVDNKEIWQSVPMNEMAWHAGDGLSMGNNNTVAIEICENADGNYAQAERNAAILTANLLIELDLPPTAIKMHRDWSGKNCPHNMLDWTSGSMGWDNYTAAVQKEYYRLLTASFEQNTQSKVKLDGITWQQKESEINLGVAYSGNEAKPEFKWSAYNLDTGAWSDIADWNGGNWASWKPSIGNYWIRAQARDKEGRVVSFGSYYSVNKNYDFVQDITIKNLVWQTTDFGFNVAANYASNDANIEFKWQAYNLDTKTWSTVSDWNERVWINWKPQIGNYWLHVEGRTANGTITSHTINFRSDTDFSDKKYVFLDGITWVSQQNSIDVGASYRSDDPNIKFKWQAYNLDIQTWTVISDWKSGNWSTWKPQIGNYWLHVEAKTEDGTIESKTINYRVSKDYSKVSYLSLDGLTWELKDDGVNVGASYSSNDPNVQFKWQAYNLDTQTWAIISDWKTGNWSTWEPIKGNYWLHVEAKNSDGATTSKTINFNIDRDRTLEKKLVLKGITWNINNSSIDVGAAYVGGDANTKFRWQAYNLDTQTWTIISDWKSGNWSTWKPVEGNYWLHVEAKGLEDVIESKTINFKVDKNY